MRIVANICPSPAGWVSPVTRVKQSPWQLHLDHHCLRVGQLYHLLHGRLGREDANHRALLPEDEREGARAVDAEGDRVVLARLAAGWQLGEGAFVHLTDQGPAARVLVHEQRTWPVPEGVGSPADEVVTHHVEVEDAGCEGDAMASEEGFERGPLP